MHSRLFRLSLLLFISHTIAVVLNRTIDDGYGDPVTGKMPIYFPPSKPESPWNNQTCGGCAIQPNLNMTHRRTYTAATYHPFLQNMSITLDFTGIAVWVFFINANNAGIAVTTMTLANFTLDDQPPHLFQHVPDMTRTDNDFDAVAYQQDGLTNTPHRLLISTTGDSDAYVNFDFAIYS
ncbi:unnamed protein product [Cyclocybe aegerita]|uniref:Uncharacterized protein n=1 Tax=Cyclocybe aegerita TaxID=1973307 RepID=A0A8S0XTF2_CYCAE|nr:unnamed protein product [Cyclocybe aegerita]